MIETLRSRRLAVAVLLLALSGLFAACGGDGGGSGDDADLRNEIKTLMMEDGSMNEEEADCFSGIMVDEIDNDVLRAAIEADASGLDSTAAQEAISEDVLTRAFDECFDLDGLLDDVNLDDLDLEGIDLEGVDQ